LRLECFDPSILKTETPPVTCAQSTLLLSPRLIWAASFRPRLAAIALAHH